MKKLLFLSLFFILAQQANSEFSLTTVDASEFPLIKTNFILTTPAGDPITDYTIQDFNVTENGVSMLPTLEITCQDAEEKKELSILLVLDASGSMDLNEGDTVRRWSWVEDAVQQFVEALDFSGRTRVAVTAFENRSRLRIDFSNNAEEIMDSVRATRIYGPTKYDPPFMAEETGAYDMLMTRPIDVSRAVIFLTDGYPDEPPKVEEIIDTMKAAGANVYTVTMLTPMTRDLTRIAQETGGRSFEVYNKEDLGEIYSLIAFDLQRKQICEMTWLSDYACADDDLNREVYIKYKPKFEGKFRNYTVPEQGIASLDPDRDLATFGNPDVDESSYRSLTFTPVNAPSTITGYSISPETYFDISKFIVNGTEQEVPFTVDTSDVFEVEMVFTQQGSKQAREATLFLEGQQCMPEVSLMGGVTDVILLTPNGSELFTSCETVEIKWTGLDESQAVNIFYSDNGNTDPGSWKPVATNVTGSSYMWDPPRPGTQYRIKLELLAQNYYDWVLDFDAEEYSSVVDVAIAPEENFVYTGGTYRGNISFDTVSYGNSGKEDIYFGKFNVAGEVVWSYRIGGSGVDSLAALATDNDGNLWITGIITKGARIGASIPNLKYSDVPYFFIAKIDPDGTFLGYQTYGASGLDAEARMWPRGMRLIAANNRMEVVGNYRKEIKLQDFPEEILPYSPQDQANQVNAPFVLIFRDNVNLVSANRNNFDIRNYGIETIVDGRENTYVAKNYIGQLNLGSYQLNSDHQKGYLSRNTKIQASEDFSEEVFGVIDPTIQFNPSFVQFGEIVTGEFESQYLTAILTNNSSVPFKPVNAYFANGTAQNWSTGTQLPDVILPGESVDIEITFNPVEIGPISSTYFVEPECGETFGLELRGTGKCAGLSEASFDLGKRTVAVRSRVQLTDAFQNISTVPVTITPFIENDPNTEFEVFVLDGSMNEVASTIVAAGDYASIVIYLTAQSEGQTTATLNYGLQAECDELSAQLSGEGVSSEVIGEEIRLVKRIYTVNDSKIVLENFGSLPVTISELQFEDNIPEFSLPGLQNSYQIDAGASIELDFRFAPMIEGNYSTVLQAKTENGQTIDMVNINCDGIQPQAVADFICPTPNVAVGDIGSGELILTNSSILADAVLVKVISNNPEFTFKNGTTEYSFVQNGVENILDMNNAENFSIEVDFAPTVDGISNVDFTIVADIALGNGVDDQFTVDSSVVTSWSCDAASSDNTVQIQLGNVLLCEDEIINLPLTNPFANDLVVDANDLVISGPNASEFDIDLAGSITIPTGDTQNIPLILKATSLGDISADVNVMNSYGVEIKFEISAFGVEILLNARTENVGVYPGNYTKATVSGSLVGLNKGDITELNIMIDLGERMVKFDENSIENELSNDWVWGDPVQLNGTQYLLSGNGSISTPFNSDLFSFLYTVYLDSTVSADLEFAVYGANCELGPQEGFTTRLDSVCVPDQRLLQFGGNLSINGISPNPASDQVDITFNIPVNTTVEINIYDYMGSKVGTIYQGYINKGTYDLSFPTKDLPSGKYFLRLSSESLIDNKLLIIER